jgi:hypothetical protein
LIFDQGLFVVRGVKRCSHHASSNLFFCPSIQPHARATSSAAGYVSDIEFDPFFAIFSHTPREDA